MEKYEYDSEYGGGKYNPENSGEVSAPPEIAPVEEVPTNEYTGGEYTDSLVGSDEQFSKNLANDVGVDLNDNADTVSEAENKSAKEIGEDLNDNGSEQLDSILDNFQENNWSDLSLEEQKQSMTNLADYVAADTGNDNPPEIVFKDDMPDGSYGGYNPGTNTMEVNVNMLDDSNEAADTIAHEMWHAHQEQAANDPNNPRAEEYQEGFDNYISPEFDFEGYQNQMVEAEARDYAQGFKDRLAGLKGAA
jgi:hypothetical protein